MHGRRCLLPSRSATSLLAAALALVALLVAAAPSSAGVANAGIPGAPKGNPIAGLPWGVYADPGADPAYAAWQDAGGKQRNLLARIALRPRTTWYGAWIPDSRATSVAQHVIAASTAGQGDALTQVALFRLMPWEGAACRSLPTAAQQASYKAWIRNFASGIGSSRVLVILQPDLPQWLCVPHRSRVPLSLVAYAARVLQALPHTTIYLDAGAGDWETPSQAAGILRLAGVRGVRGFALNVTHYDSTQNEILFGQRVVRALAARRIGGKHFVVNTAANGHPFTHQQVRSNFANVATCKSRGARRCVSLGIPPTTDVANPRWGLSASARSAARRLVDGYLWVNRPWLINQSNPFSLSRALDMASSTPF